jgi:hypothetical protein
MHGLPKTNQFFVKSAWCLYAGRTSRMTFTDYKTTDYETTDYETI